MQQLKHFSIGLWPAKKVDFTWQLVTTSSMAGQETLKHFPKPNWHQKGHGHCLVLPVCSTTAFLSSGETITSEKYVSKSMRYTENCNACSWHGSTERAQFFCRQHLTTRRQSMFQKLHKLHYKVLPHPAYSWPLANRILLLQASWQLFAGKMLPQPAEQCKKCFPRSWIPKHRFLWYKNKQTYFLIAKMYWL